MGSRLVFSYGKVSQKILRSTKRRNLSFLSLSGRVLVPSIVVVYAIRGREMFEISRASTMSPEEHSTSRLFWEIPGTAVIPIRTYVCVYGKCVSGRHSYLLPLDTQQAVNDPAEL